MSKTTKSYSLNYNEKEGHWIARVKRPDGTWKTKYLPVTFGPQHAWEAEQHLIQWYGAFLKQEGEDEPRVKVGATKKTLETMSGRWLTYREDDNTGTKINTYKGFKLSVKNWILDNAKFPHERIAHLDLETEFTVDATRRWIQSLGGSYSSRIQHVNTLKSFFNDCIGNEWLDPEVINPMEKVPIRRLIRQMAEAKRRNHIITVFSAADIHTMLSKPQRKVKDLRRLRYLTAVGTGMRKEEIQGMVVGDVVLDSPIPHVKVERQLYKIGHGPFQRWEELVERGASKSDAMASTHALMSDPKKHSGRVIPLHPLLVLALKWWLRKGWALEVGRKPTADDPLFPRNRVSLKKGQKAGEFTCINDASRTMQFDLKRLGLSLDSNGKALTFQSFRHTFATMLEEAGVPQERRDHLMGHKPKTVAASNYVAKNLASYATEVAKLPLGQVLTLSRETLSLPSARVTENVVNSANVVSFPTIGSVAPASK